MKTGVPLFDNPPPPPNRKDFSIVPASVLDKILANHLPDSELCKRGKQLNKARRERLKADILNWLQPNKYEKGKGGTVYHPEMIIVDEQQLGI